MPCTAGKPIRPQREATSRLSISHEDRAPFCASWLAYFRTFPPPDTAQRALCGAKNKHHLTKKVCCGEIPRGVEVIQLVLLHADFYLVHTGLDVPGGTGSYLDL